MKLKYTFVINEIADKKVAVAVGDDLDKFGGFIKMNSVGAFIFEQLKNDVTEEQSVDAIMQTYTDATREEAAESVSEFIEKLKASNVIE